jgi:hypothetical protein
VIRGTFIDECGVTHEVTDDQDLDRYLRRRLTTRCGLSLSRWAYDHVKRNADRDRVVNCIACIATEDP